jgi:hypothetical protein
LVLGASNAVQPEVPMENYHAMIQAWKDFGPYEARTEATPNKPDAGDGT